MIEEIAPGLIADAAGFWRTAEETLPSYPAGGNDAFFPIEEESFWFAHRNRAIVAAVRRHPPADGPIFDVGAGNGYVSAALEREGFPTVAIEPNAAGAANAVARRVTNVVCGSLPSTAFRKATAGGIALFDVLEHVQKDQAFLESLRPYLGPGGRLYVTVPAFSWLWSDNDVRSGHFRRYTIRALERTLRGAGFRVDYATYIFWFLPLPIVAFRLLHRNNSQAHARRQHAAGAAMMRHAAEAFLGFETRLIRRGISIPFGGSCLVIASLA